METLYVTTMIAIFVLCLALLSTARRILRSSPLSSGELSLSRMYDVQTPESTSDSFSPEDRAMPEMEEADASRSVFDSVTHATKKVGAVESWMAASIMTETLEAETSVIEPIASQSLMTTNAVVVNVKPETVGTVVAVAAKEDLVLTQTVHLEAAAVQAEVAEQPVSAPQRKRNFAGGLKQIPHSYNYVLECLLLGVSLVVLVKTQRSNSRNRALQSSQHRVA